MSNLLKVHCKEMFSFFSGPKLTDGKIDVNGLSAILLKKKKKRHTVSNHPLNQLQMK